MNSIAFAKHLFLLRRDHRMTIEDLASAMGSYTRIGLRVGMCKKIPHLGSEQSVVENLWDARVRRNSKSETGQTRSGTDPETSLLLSFMELIWNDEISKEL